MASRNCESILAKIHKSFTKFNEMLRDKEFEMVAMYNENKEFIKQQNESSYKISKLHLPTKNSEDIDMNMEAISKETVELSEGGVFGRYNDEAFEFILNLDEKEFKKALDDIFQIKLKLTTKHQLAQTPTENDLNNPFNNINGDYSIIRDIGFNPFENSICSEKSLTDLNIQNNHTIVSNNNNFESQVFNEINGRNSSNSVTNNVINNCKNTQKNNNVKVNNNSQKKIHFQNVDCKVPKEALMEIFKQFGKITDMRIFPDKHSSKIQYGYICYENSTSADNAISNMDKKLIYNRPLCVIYAPTKNEQSNHRAQRNNYHTKSQVNLCLPVDNTFYLGAPRVLETMPMKNITTVTRNTTKEEYQHFMKFESKPSQFGDEYLQTENSNDIKEKIYRAVEKKYPEDAFEIMKKIIEENHLKLECLLQPNMIDKLDDKINIAYQSLFEISKKDGLKFNNFEY